MTQPLACRRGARQHGAALLLAMVIVALVATVTAGMVWQQNRAVGIEAAERARAQSVWILNGALDWARLILREDQRTNQQRSAPYDALGEPWAQPLAEARLSSFLAADKDNNADSGPEAFISGAIEDAQSRFNLRGLVDDTGKPVAVQLAVLERLAALAGAPSDAAARVAQALGAARSGAAGEDPGGPPIRPARLADLSWAGLDPATLARLEPFVDLLPSPTPVNLNTASREVIAAVLDLDLGAAERLLQSRQRKPFERLEDVQPLLPARAGGGSAGTAQAGTEGGTVGGTGAVLEPARVGVGSSHFHVAGRLRLEDRVLEERSLLVRRDGRVDVLRRERRSFSVPQR